MAKESVAENALVSDGVDTDDKEPSEDTENAADGDVQEPSDDVQENADDVQENADDVPDAEGVDVPVSVDDDTEYVSLPNEHRAELKKYEHPKVGRPRGVIYVPGEAIIPPGTLDHGLVTITEDTYLVDFLYNSKRPVYTLIYAKGAEYPENVIEFAEVESE